MVLQPMTILALIVAFISAFLLCCALFFKRREQLQDAERANILLVSRAARANQPTASGLPQIISDSFPISEFSEGQLTKSEENCCSVCLVDYEPKDKVQLTPCQHSFHPDCLQMWLRGNCTCPICRVSFAAPLEPVVLLHTVTVESVVIEEHTPVEGEDRAVSVGTVSVGDNIV